MSDLDNTMGYTKLTLDEINRRLNEADDLAMGDCPDLVDCVKQLLADHRLMTDTLEMFTTHYVDRPNGMVIARKALNEVTK